MQVAHNNGNIHSLAALLGLLASTRTDPLFALMHCVIDSTKCWNYPAEIVVHNNMISITQLLQICCLHFHDVNFPFQHDAKARDLVDCGGH